MDAAEEWISTKLRIIPLVSETQLCRDRIRSEVEMG